MSHRKKFYRKVVSIMFVLVFIGGLLQPVLAEGTTDTAGTAQETPNVTGNLTQGGAPLSGITFSIRAAEADTWYDTTSDGGGKFSFSLPDGDYRLSGIWLEAESRWYPLDRTIRVVNGVLADTTSLDIDLPAQQAKNVNGTVTKDGQPLPSVTFSIHTTEEPLQWYDATTKSDGTFQFALNDGRYKIEGIWVSEESRWYPLSQTFKVVNGILEGHEALNIALNTPVEQPKYKVSGTLTQAGQPLVDILFSLRSTGEEAEWYSTTTEQNGQFEFHLPQGEYEIIGIWIPSDTKWYVLNQTFTVHADTTQNIEIPALPAPKEITGTLTKSGSPLADISFSVHSAGEEPVWYDTESDETGSFVFKDLPDGDYQLDGVWIEDELKWYFLQVKFAVQDGELAGADPLAIDILEQQKTIKGKVVKGKTPVTDVWVSAHTSNENPTWYDVLTDETGTFQFQLPDGDYRIEGIWIGSEETWYSHPVNFTVLDGKLSGVEGILIDLQAEAANPVTGTVVDGATPLVNATVYFEKADDPNEYYGADTNAEGQFSIELEDGEYYLASVYIPNLADTLYIYKKFSVVDGKLYINGAAAETLDVTLPPASLVLQLSKGGTVIKPNAVYIYSVEHNFGYWGYPDAFGRVTYRVPDGMYEVEGYYGSDGYYTYINQTVEVKNGTTNPNPYIMQIENKDTLQGNVLDENGSVANAQFIIEDLDHYFQYWVTAGSDGSYSINVPDGNYFIHEINKGTTPYAAVDLKFTVTGGKVYRNNQEFPRFDITVPVKSLNGQLKAGGAPLTGEIYFERMINGVSYFYSGKTDSNGAFAFRVPDGVYTITSVNGNNGTWYQVDTTVTITEGMTSPSPFIIDVNQGNLKGAVTDESGPLANVDFFIDSVDGFSYYWIETNENGEFTSFIPDGNYYIHSVWLDSGDEVYPDLFFSVSDGKVQLNGAPADSLNVAIPGETLKVQMVNGSAAVTGEMFAGRVMNGIPLYYYAMTNEYGEFVMQVPDGVYTMELFYSAEGMHEIYQSVEVTNGTTNPSPYVMDISGL